MWDAGLAAAASSGRSLSEGRSTWTPAGLLATAAGASLQSTFLDIADDAQLPILEYVAQQHPVDPLTHEVSHIVLSARISVPTHHAEKAISVRRGDSPSIEHRSCARSAVSFMPNPASSC